MSDRNKPKSPAEETAFAARDFNRRTMLAYAAANFAELGQLPAFLDYVRRMAEAAGLPEDRAARLELAVEEALAFLMDLSRTGKTEEEDHHD